MPDSHSRPNFLIFIVDQMSSFSLGCHGNPDVKTPNLDRLCAQGISFTRAYCCNPVCSPSRASLHTGLTPRQHGLLTNGSKLSYHVPTLPQVLTENGYRTHCVGKIHLQPFTAEQQEEDGTPVSWESRMLWERDVISKLPIPYYGYQGVDYIGGHVHYVHGDYANDVNARHPGTTQQLSLESAYHSVPGSQTWRLSIAPELHYNHWIADRAIAFLDSLQDHESFFLVSSFPDPHHPFAACRPYSEQIDPASVTLPPTWEQSEDPCPYLSQHDRSRWASWNEPILRESIAQTYGMINHIDENVGRVLDHLEETGLADNTIVVFLSDHGEYLGAHHLLLKGPWPYEQVVRVPFIWRDPQADVRSPNDGVVSLIDFVPTILDYADIDPERFDLRGVRISEPLGLPGRSLRKIIGGESTAEGVQIGTPEESGALIEFDEDFLPAATCCRYRMLVTSQYKLCLYGGTGDGVLFDLVADPHERRNLWSDPGYAETKGQMLAMLADRLALTDRWDVPRYCGA